MKRTVLVLMTAVAVASMAAIADTAVTVESIVMERPDGSKQCEPGPSKKNLLRDAKKELSRAGVRAVEVASGHDGRVHAQICGAPTGRVIRIRVRASDREKAAGIGFSVPDASGR